MKRWQSTLVYPWLASQLYESQPTDITQLLFRSGSETLSKAAVFIIDMEILQKCVCAPGQAGAQTKSGGNATYS